MNRLRPQRVLQLAVTAGLVLVLAGHASATQQPIDDVELEGGDTTVFDPDNDEPGNDECLRADLLNQNAYTPVDDGASANSDDAYDGGMILYVGGTTFRDDNNEGNEVGEQIKVGPRNTGGVSVTRKDRALADSPTLRDLIAFKNTHNSARTLGILIQNDYGADTTEVVKGTAHVPGLSFQTNDRWLLVADDATAPSDALVTNAWYGRGAAERLVNVTNDIPNADGCLGVSYRISVPANSTKYLLLFAQLHDASAVADAKDDARVFDRKHLPASFLLGLSTKVKNNVLNWNL